MKILAVETTATAASCCLTDDGRVLGRFAVNAGLTHSRTLLPMIEQLLGGCGVQPSEIGLYAVAAGPGSFTGVRIGVAAVKGLALPGNTPCVGVSTLAAMARLWDGVPMTATVCAAMDARCQQVYTALFAVKNGVVSRLTPDEAISLDELKDKLVAVDGPAIIGLRPIAKVDAEDCEDSRHTGRQGDVVGILEQIIDAATAQQKEERAEGPQKAFHTVTAFHQWYFSPRLILNAR